MEKLVETIFGSVLGFLFGIGSGCSLSLLSALLLSEATGLNVFSAVVPFALLHAAFFNTALTLAVGLKFEENVWKKIEKALPGFVERVLNALRRAQSLTLTGGVIMSLGFITSRHSEKIILDLGSLGLVIAITSELRTPKTMIFAITTVLAMMNLAMIDSGSIVITTLIILLYLPFVIMYIWYKFAQNISPVFLTAAVLALIFFAQPRLARFFSQYLALCRAILTALSLNLAVVIFGFIMASMAIGLVIVFPYLLWGDAIIPVLVSVFSLVVAVAVVHWQGALGPAAFLSPAACIYYYVHFEGLKAIPSFVFALVQCLCVCITISKSWCVELTSQATDVINLLIVALEMVAIFLVACTLAIIFGIAVSWRAQNPERESKAAILTWAGAGAALTVAFVVRIVYGQILLLKALAVSVLISLGFCFLLQILTEPEKAAPLRNNISERVKQLGSMYAATLVMGLAVTLISGWVDVLSYIGVFLAITTVRLIYLPAQEV